MIHGCGLEGMEHLAPGSVDMVLCDLPSGETAAAASSLNPKPYDKRAAVDRLVADGRAEYVSAFEFKLTQKGLEWLGTIAGAVG